MTQRSGTGPLRLGSFTPSVVLEVARRIGYLADAGLEVAESAVASSPAQFDALRRGELDVALTSPDNVIAYRFCPDNPLASLLDARIVGAVDRGMGLGLYARPGTAGVAELRGATFGVDVPTSGFALAMYACADSLGLPRDAYRLSTLGSTPKRLRALLGGECEATMLNAGNELRAEAAGCPRLAAATQVCAPYLGTVVSVVGDRHLSAAQRLAEVLRETASRVIAGELDEVAITGARSVLGLKHDLAVRCLARLRDPDDGLTSGPVDLDALATLIDLRLRYLGDSAGDDPLRHALDPASGLVVESVPNPLAGDGP